VEAGAIGQSSRGSSRRDRETKLTRILAPHTGKDSLSARLLAWWDSHGRKDLPWQRRRTAYRIWLAEIMLQQTQVATVIPYYERFLERFPDVRALAIAPLAEVLRLWAGLGYYARARNLHHCAQCVAREFGGVFPRTIGALQTLPGIGRSTAGAILAFAHDQRHPILDGNVKRVLGRYHAVDGWSGRRDIENKLWELAERHTPFQRNSDYTQAIMDLGATVCTRAKPRCSECPLFHECKARLRGEVARYPSAKARKTFPVRSVQFLIVSDEYGSVLLQARPPTGIWGGLWSFPEIDVGVSPLSWCHRNGFKILGSKSSSVLRHKFSHFCLDIHPTYLVVRTTGARAMEAEGWLWYNSRRALPVGVATPVRKLIAKLGEDT
jgi:A/G-specific adenine glycosylase